MADLLIYNFKDVIRLIREDAERQGVKIKYIRPFLDMKDTLYYKVIPDEY